MQGKKQDNKHRKQIRFGELFDEINEVRGVLRFGSWVKLACEEKLKRDRNKINEPQEETP